MFKEAFTKSVSGSLAKAGGPSKEDALLDALARPNPTDLDDFRRGIDPLASAGKLGALLAQFPPSFKDSPASRDYLAWLLEAFAGHRLAVELRHSSWSDAIGDTQSLLNPFGAAWVQIDEPKFRFSIQQNFLPNVEGTYYMRLHGRNAKEWWSHEKVKTATTISTPRPRSAGSSKPSTPRVSWSARRISTPTITSGEVSGERGDD